MSLKIITKLKDSLLFRLTILYTLTFIFVSAISFLVFYYHIYSVTMERMDSELLEETREYSKIMNRNNFTKVKNKISRDMESEDPKEEFYRIIGFSGNVLFATDMSSWEEVDIEGPLARLKGDENSHEFKTITLSGSDGKARMISAVIGLDTMLQIGETLEEVDEYLEIFRNLFSILIIILIGVATIIGWFLAKQALIDMKQVTQIAEDISKGSYDRRVQVKAQFVEIRRLGGAFNNMLDRIQNLLKSTKEISDNIAHDLRSPLARIRGIAEMTLTDDTSINDYRDMAVSTIEECDSLIDMINTMLDITEAEAGVNATKNENLDFVELISDACELFRPMAEEKIIELKVILPEVLTFRGNKKKMQRIVTNILENAIKYTPEHGKVTILAKSDDGGVQIIFEDNGCGISELDLPHIFDRFYRCDRSRSQGGVGLGLSLAKAYTESMNGLIQVTSTINQGSTFTFMFNPYNQVDRLMTVRKKRSSHV